MRDLRVDKLAELLLNYSLDIQPGEKTLIWADAPSAPLIQATYEQIIHKGAFPFVYAVLPGLAEALLEYGTDEQIRFTPEPFAQIFETFDSMVFIRSLENTRFLGRAEAAKVVEREKGLGKLRRIYTERTAKGQFRWVLTLFPTNAHAQDADMALRDYENFVFNACLPDLNDPVSYWKGISAYQARIIDWLKGKERVHVLGKDTDLRLRIDNRKFINCDCHVNVPDGEVYTGPVEDSVEGHVHFSYPAIYRGKEVQGVRLQFEKGKVVSATADKNEAYLNKMLDTDAGSRYVGEFAIGTNKMIQQFTGQILFDEKIGGSFHMAMGNGYPETGSKNQSLIHWDMICDLRDGGQIWVDDQLIYENGDFVLNI